MIPQLKVYLLSPCSVCLVLKWTGDVLLLLHVSTSNTSLCDVETSVISRQTLLKLDFLPLRTDFTSSQTKRTYFHRRNMEQHEARRCVWRTAQPWIHHGISVRPGHQPSGRRRSRPGTTLWCCWSSSASCCSTCWLMLSVSCWGLSLLFSWYSSCKSAPGGEPNSLLWL